MKPRAVLLGTFTAGLIGIGGYLALGAGEAETQSVAAAIPVRATAVMTARAALPPGHMLRPDDLVALPWPGETVPAAAIVEGSSHAQKLAGSVTRRAFVAGEMVVDGATIAPGERGFLAAIVAPGKRAVAISVDAANAAGGLIWPGDRVDVVLTQEIEGDGIAAAQRVVGETILSDARVLSSDQRLGTAADTGAAASAADAVKPETRIPTTVTIEVDQAEAERVAVAATLGKLSLALRAVMPGTADATASDGGPTWAGRVSPALTQVRIRPPAQSAPVAAATAPGAAPAAAAVPRGVRIYRGSQAGA